MNFLLLYSFNVYYEFSFVIPNDYIDSWYETMKILFLDIFFVKAKQRVIFWSIRRNNTFTPYCLKPKLKKKITII